MSSYRAYQKDPKRKKRIRFILIPILALIAILALVLFKTLYLDRAGKIEKDGIILEGPYRVLRVADGDTFTIKKDGKEVKVRLIGVDAPESAAPSYSGKENTKEGKIAADYLTRLISGKNVYLEYDLDTYDQYGRLLAYVYLSDQTTMLQEHLLSEGYVHIMTYQPNVKYVEQFLKLEQQARKDGKGFWKE